MDVLAILYYLFRVAWLNSFLFIGYTRSFTLIIALSAIGFGINKIYQLILNRGVAVCHIEDNKKRQNTIHKIRKTVNAPIGFASVIDIVGLAFAVNAIEFVCSSALPVIYIHTLSLIEMSALKYYLYILLDDLIIFLLAIFAMQKVVNSSCASYSQAIGGLILLGLGGLMLLK
ncbi:MAG: hypothetical protein ACI9TO_000325 [Rickettsiales bacterium]